VPPFKTILENTANLESEKRRDAITEYERSVTPDLERELAAIGKRVLAAAPDEQAMLAAVDTGRERLNALLEGIRLSAVLAGVESGSAILNAMVRRRTKAVLSLVPSWELRNQSVIDWVRNEHWFSSQSLLEGMAETERNRIRSMLSGFATEQITQEQLAESIMGASGIYGPNRAQLIARTEVTHMFAQGNRTAFAARGVERVTWRTKADELVCPICGPLDGQQFPVDGSEVPPAHPGCRCWVVPHVDVAALDKAIAEREAQEAGSSLEESAQGGRLSFGNLEAPSSGRGVAERDKLYEMFDKVTVSPLDANAQRLSDLELGKITPEEFISLINKWNQTSNDSSLPALRMQEVVGDLVGRPLSDWQRQRLERVLQERLDDLASIGGSWGNLPQSNLVTYGDKFNPLEVVGKKVVRSADDAIEATRQAADALYTDTQRFLANQDIKEVVVYRGVSGKSVVGLRKDELVTVGGNALESWTVDISVATDFAQDVGGVVIEAVVPSNRIFGTGLNGFGTVYEKEVVVIQTGSKADVVRVVATY